MKDQRILELIKENPFISQQELSEKLGLSRSAVAGYISSLTKRGEIIGRAYVVKNRAKITCIGGANIDRKTKTLAPVQYGTSNPASSMQSRGGVARNVAENLGRLSCDVSLVGLIGEDQDGKWLLDETKRYGVDVSQSMTLNGEKTGTYTSILDEAGELVLAVADMTIYEKFRPDMIESRWPLLASSEILFADTNLPEETLQYLIDRCDKEEQPLWIHTVSTPKTRRLPENLRGVEVLFINREEAEALTGMEAATMEGCRKASAVLQERGVSRVIIHLDQEGIFVRAETGEEEQISPVVQERGDETGVKEAFIGGMLYGVSHGESFGQAIQLGMAASDVTWQTEETVADLSVEMLYEQMENKGGA